MIEGITVTLYDMVQIGTDAFLAPVFDETPVQVANVLVCPLAAADVADGLQLYGKRAEYELYLPKGDTHCWEDRKVSFFGQLWHTVGFVTEYIGPNVPLAWNRKIRVERYG